MYIIKIVVFLNRQTPFWPMKCHTYCISAGQRETENVH